MASWRLALLLVLAAACHGPEPRVVAAGAAPDSSGGWHVWAVVANDGGEGEVQVTLGLRDLDGGEVYEEEKNLELGRGARRGVTAELHPPAGRYAASASAEYPIP